MAINLGSSFNVVAGIPLDTRFIVADLTARDALVSGVRYEGMLTYVEAELKMYQLQGGITNSDWKEAGGGGGGSIIPLSISADHTLLEDEANIVLVDTSGGDVILDLPTNYTFFLFIKKTTTDANVLTINTTGGAYMDDKNTIDISLPFGWMILGYDSTSNIWNIVGLSDKKILSNGVRSITTSTFQGDEEEIVLANCSGGQINYALKATTVAMIGTKITAIKTDSSINSFVFVPDGSELINGQSSLAIYDQDISYTLVCVAVGSWRRI